MKILKFGGSSVGDAHRIENVISILHTYKNSNEKISVVFSAFQGVTDKLIEIGSISLKHDNNYRNEVKKLYRKHISIVEELNKVNQRKKSITKIDNLFNELGEILHGIFLLKEATPRSMDYIVSFGEKLSCTIISDTLNNRGFVCEYLDASSLIKTDDFFGNARVNFEVTDKNIKDYFARHKSTQIITGFIASTENNETTTLGRGGSDYTASIFGAALNVDEIQIWTDVDGILTADPRKVSDSFPLKAVTYEEAMELSHFGAKVIYPPTMLPALKKKIKIRIKNTFNPSFHGTVILEREDSIAFNVKGISSIDEISLVRVEGGGMVGVTGIAWRLFGALAEKGINIILISQASSEHSICFAVLPKHGKDAKKAIQDEFKYEIIEGRIGEVVVEENLSVIAVVGEDMKQTPGIAGKVFQALGKNGINILAIAQGSSELNISLVVDRDNLTKAMNVLHDALFISRQKHLNIFMVGPGLVGRELLKLIEERNEFISKEFYTKVRLIALANSKRMVFNSKGMNPGKWNVLLSKSENKTDASKFVNEMIKLNLPNSIFVDCTASVNYIPHYIKILSSSISIVTPNKIANTQSYENYTGIHEAARKHNVQFRYGTNVGAALPVISNLRDLVNNGDKIVKIEGVLSGTLGYVFDNLKPGKKFSEIVCDAKMKGYTEPDPRDDLSGLDVARKLLILIRESRIKFELADIKIENLVPLKAREVKSVDEFFNILKEYDGDFNQRILSAQQQESKLCYIASYENGHAKVDIETINRSHPFYNLSGTDNIVAFTTKNYSVKPLVIRGPGAGADNTAFGVFVDIMRISNYLG